MKVRWASAVLEAANLLIDHDAVLIRDKPGKPVLILFENEERRDQAKKAIGGIEDGEYHGYPALSCESSRLYSKLERLPVKNNY